MKIWIDADACPVAIREILYKAAERRRLQLTLVANSPIRIPSSPYIRFVRVAAGSDVADKAIVTELTPGDLVITADIPLAAAVVEKGAHALNPRGEMYSVENVRDRLSMRDFMDSLRSDGIETGGPPPLTKRDRQTFANNLDTFLSRYCR
ncbi:YaiI/YqxD family protein [Desulfopila aestuarii]|uniref:UPF0178 protein SAMN02745220_02313 n=1 Tax=Desulfopila aestuarii DSM 18488 TaxID=1121416 RepID=A0A1M7Y780_9BACT|nr:YaiI/YqxD family protein [Desulfopila aestuarii]SHO48464.1 hypothetical protein SAMN02745220_02313 [Desulfopila aestuarii DSM 18488]